MPCRTLRRYVAMSRDEPDTIFYLPEQNTNMQATQPSQHFNHVSCGLVMSRGSAASRGNNSTGVSGLDELLGSASGCDQNMSTSNSTGVSGLGTLLGSTDSYDAENCSLGTDSSFSQGRWSSWNLKPEPLCRGDSFNSLTSELSLGSIDSLNDDMIVDDVCNGYAGNDFNPNTNASTSSIGQAAAAESSNLLSEDEMSFDFNFSDFR